MIEPDVVIERVNNFTPEVAKGLGALMPDLTEGLSGEPVNTDVLNQIIESPDRDLILAHINGRIVGSAVMNLIVFASGKKAWLEDFVVSADDSIRGTGVGFSIWKEVVTWAEEREAPLEFLSSSAREQAHRFYRRQGAEIKPTSVFHYE